MTKKERDNLIFATGMLEALTYMTLRDGMADALEEIRLLLDETIKGAEEEVDTKKEQT